MAHNLLVWHASPSTHKGGSGFTRTTFCVELVGLLDQHTLDNALLASENMDCAEAGTKWVEGLACQTNNIHPYSISR